MELAPPPEKAAPDTSLNVKEADNENGEAHGSLRHIKGEIEELLVVTLNGNKGLLASLPKEILATDCTHEMLHGLAAVCVVAEKQQKDPVKVLKRTLEALAEDRGGIVTRLFTKYAERVRTMMDGSTIVDQNTPDKASIVVRKKDGNIELPTVYRSSVHLLFKEMAAKLDSFYFDKRVAMRGITDESVRELFENVVPVIAETNGEKPV